MIIVRFALLLLVAVSSYAAPVVLNVKDFGAKGDGVTDDYAAMQAAATALCASDAGSRLVYPPGTYRINRYRVFRGPSPNGVDDIVYRNCSGVTISGYGAVIDVKGDFHQGADVFADGFWYSYVKQVTPFFMIDSSDFTIEGFEMVGNVQQMTRDPRALEDSCAGITTRRCSRYLLRDMNIHHFSVDSVQLGFLDFDDAFITDKDVRIENVNGHHDGRVGLVIGHVRRAWIVDSIFTHAGETEGAFGSFVPQAGTDIEPDFTVADDGVDVGTGEIYFINSTFSANKGPDLLASFPERVDTVVVYGTNVVSAPDGYSAYAMVVGAKTAVVENSTIDLRNGKGLLLGTWDMGSLSSIASITYANNHIRLSTNGSLISEGSAPYDFVGNDVRVTSAGPDGTIMDLGDLRRLTGNKFFIDAAGSTGGTGQAGIRTNATQTVLSNEYRTNRTAGSFTTTYGNGSTIRGELFPNAPAFTPAGSANWSPTAPYPSAATTVADNTAPAISNIAAVHLSERTLISWLTDEAATSVVEYGPTQSYGNTAQLTGLTRYHPVFLTNLQLGATIQYRVRSTDAAGLTTTSGNRTFTVPSSRPPVVTTTSATNITPTGATLNGTVNPGGSTSVATSFEYGPTTSYGSTVNAQTLSGTTTQSISAAVSGLTCGTTLHYRAKATSFGQTRYGADQTFTTAPCACTSFTINPASANPSAGLGSQVVTITGAPAGCVGGNWSASGNGSWLTVSPASGSGSGSTTVSWTQNTSVSPRSGAATIAGRSFTVTQRGTSVAAKAFSDFDGDGKSDVLWYHRISGETYLWTMDAYTSVAVSPVGVMPNLNWKIAGLGDFNADAKTDVLWRHAGTGENRLWLMNGPSITAQATINFVADQNWKIAAIADYDGDGRADIFWRHAVSGDNYMYLMNGSSIIVGTAVPRLSDTRWKLAASGDLSGDGKADIVWRHTASGETYAWLMNGYSIAGMGGINTVPDQNWTIAGVHDFDGDAKADLFWRHLGTGENYMYRMNGSTVIAAGVVNDVTDLNWKLSAMGDYDGDGKSGVFWHHAVSGDTYMYLMDGFTIVTGADSGNNDDLNWTPVR
ncbi:MAG TPA: FG-GAP-like repeat-containing protein [Thermoanaerobaculia bacterium]|nr:FG-GAP-like repeat-containing protein [Thermoanaerobaculia bacterium]